MIQSNMVHAVIARRLQPGGQGVVDGRGDRFNQVGKKTAGYAVGIEPGYDKAQLGQQGERHYKQKAVAPDAFGLLVFEKDPFATELTGHIIDGVLQNAEGTNGGAVQAPGQPGQEQNHQKAPRSY